MSSDHGIQFRPSDYSIAELLKVAERYPIIRTAHPGNFDYVTLAIARHFPVLLRESITGEAVIYEPAYIKKDQKRVAITEQPAHAVPFIGISNASLVKEICSLEAKTALELHYQSLRGLGLQVTPSVETIIENPSLEDILQVVAITCPQHFNVYYDEAHEEYKLIQSKDKTNIYKNRKGAERHISYAELPMLFLQHLAHIKSSYQGTIKTDIASVDVSNALFHVLLVASYFNKKSALDKIYHLCGARMYDYLYRDSRYAPVNQRELAEVYEILAKVGFVPKQITFMMVPTSQLRPFVKREAYNPEEVYDLYNIWAKKVKNHNAKKRDIAIAICEQPQWSSVNTIENLIIMIEKELFEKRTASKIIKSIIKKLRTFKDINKAKGYAVSCLYSSLFPDIEDKEELEKIMDFTSHELPLGSQYDLINPDIEVPSFPDFIIEMKQTDVALLWKKLMKVQKLL